MRDERPVLLIRSLELLRLRGCFSEFANESLCVLIRGVDAFSKKGVLPSRELFAAGDSDS